MRKKGLMLFVRAAILTAGLALATAAAGSLVDINLSVPKIVFKDGTSVSDVTIKTFDPAIGRVMVQSGKTFTSYSVAAFPDDIVAKLKSMSPAEASEPEKPSTVVPAEKHEPSPAPTDVKPVKEHVVDPAVQEAKAEKAAKAKAKEKAENYFRYEYRFGSNSVTIRNLKIELDEPAAVPGWQGRYCTQGHAYIDYFDSVGDSFGRTDSSFEVTTEPDARGNLKVVDLTTK